jgi:hypothetical protein
VLGGCWLISDVRYQLSDIRYQEADSGDLRSAISDREAGKNPFLQGLKPIGLRRDTPGLKPRPPKEEDLSANSEAAASRKKISSHNGHAKERQIPRFARNDNLVLSVKQQLRLRVR